MLFFLFCFVLTTQYLSESEPNLTCTNIRRWFPGMSVRNNFNFTPQKTEINSSLLCPLAALTPVKLDIFCMYYCVGEGVRGLGAEGRVYICEFSATFSLGCKGLYCEC